MATAKKTAAKIKEAKAMATSKKVARDANYINISDYKVQGTRTAMRNRMQIDRSKTAGRAKNMESKLKKAVAKKATSYSPAPMSAAAKAKAAARGKETAAKTKTRGPKAGSSVVSKVVKRAKTTAREARDIPTAFGGIKDVLTNKGNTRPKGGKVNQLKSSIKNVASQVKETGKAAATGKKGRPAQKYQTSRGDTPATFWTQPKRK